MREGIKPDLKKINAIINLEQSKDKKQARQFRGILQYHWKLWPKRSEILAKLMELTKGGPTKNFPI